MKNNIEWKLNNRITLTSGNMSWKYVGIQESNTKKQLFWQACPMTQDLKVTISGHKADKINQFEIVMPYLQKFIITVFAIFTIERFGVGKATNFLKTNQA